MSMKKQGRNSSIELLRVLSLIMIFWMHAAGSYQGNGISAWISIAVSVIGNIGVSCFILISGYYGIRLDVKKMIRLDLMLIFYSWSALALQILWGNRPGGEELLSYLFPVIGKRSWYFTCYFALAFLSPFLNEMVELLGKQKLKRLLATMLVLFSGITTVFFFDMNGDGGKGIVHMVMLYLIGRYIRVYGSQWKLQTGRLLKIFAAVSAVNFCLNGALYIATGVEQNRYARDNTLFTIAQAVCIFLIFKNSYFENPFINRLAVHVPAVFMFEWTMRGIITTYVVDYTAYAKSSAYELILLGIAVVLVLMGSVIDAVRMGAFHRAEERFADWVYEKGKRAADGMLQAKRG